MSASPIGNGRINLEQQRKRARELLRRLKNGAEPAKLAFLHSLNASSSVKLSDAQWLIAKDLGFSSWPKLKAHIDAIDFIARNPRFAADDEVNTVHWRCGNDIEHSLRLAGFKGIFHTLTDPLCMGPVQGLAHATYRTQRIEFIRHAFGMDLGEVTRRFDQEYEHLAKVAELAHGVLWCEADAYDQLFLIRVLASLEHLPQKLELIEIGQIPGVARFIGIGQLSPDVLAWLWPQRRLIGREAHQLARQAWSAYCCGSPLQMAELAHQAHACLPFLAPALRRQLQELPHIKNGLSLTERLSLQYINEAGPVAFASVYAELMERREPLPYLGDIMFYAVIKPLIDADEPLVAESDPNIEWPRRLLTLTRLGLEVIQDRAYWPDYASQKKWIGGVCISPRQPHWAIGDDLHPVWRE
ncbi:DUF1835 domain-containing protein [Acerihabitans sp. TG2]|uniref:DUF1835 domain-containing protein n=1 Tax=Acerihabitans sp. TG2 TaxID=3096008 RepID=UPI002B22BC63|nr:DUF1835 domain-containing protein [Acerihabitans sp. TG2]MEA9390254.1 DUF1835 domain-containing protein [Acerihabitans sp. TG2]